VAGVTLLLGVPGLAVGVVVGAGTGPAAATEHDPDPLHVDITRVSPATVPTGPRAMVRIVGTVTNLSTSPFTRINVHPVTSASPITDPASLAAAAATDADTYVGDRITSVGAFDTIDTLDPGESAEFRIRVSPAALELGTQSGVYWLGVHALGDGEEPRDEFADGRARTFIPLLPEPATPPSGGPGGPDGPDGPDGEDPGAAREPVPSALVVPLRADIRYAADGSLLFPRAWARTLSEGGRLHELLDAGVAADGTPLTWLVDPAVPDAVARLAAGNPPRTLAPPADASGPQATATPSPSPTDDETEGDEGDEGDGSGEPGSGSSDAESPDETTEAEQQTAAAAQAWLDTFSEVMSGSEVLALPFGDVDVSAAAQHDPQTYRDAVRRSSTVLSSFGVGSTPAVASPDGRLSERAVAMTSSGTVVLMPDDAFTSAPDSATVDVDGREVVVTSSGAREGGPGPGDAHGALALRQRLLSEAALRRLAGDDTPLVTVLPDTWHPEDASPLFRTRAVDWYEPVSLGDVTSAAAGETTPDAPPVTWTARDRRRLLPASSFTTATAVGRPALVLDGILTEGSTLPAQVEDEALTTLSYAARMQPRRSAARAEQARRHLAGLLDEITVEAPSSATLSSATGSIGTTLVNGLDQTVTVRVDAISDEDLEMVEQKVVELAPLSRTPMILEVATRRTGIHEVRLVVTDEQGRRLGSATELPIRAAQVSELIWYIMGGGALLLFSAIAVRIVRRIRGHPGSDTSAAVDGEGA